MKNKYRVEGEVTKILVESEKHGLFEVLIDTEDLERVKEIGSWSVSLCKKSESYYVRGNKYECGRWKTIGIHRHIMRVTDPKMQVDHIFHNTLDNRKKHLRIVTPSENNQNSRMSKNNTSGITGVSWHEPTGRWQARIHVKGKEMTVGYFDCIKKAKKARLEAEEKYFKYRYEIQNKTLKDTSGV